MPLPIIDDVTTYARFSAGMFRFFRGRLTLDEARRTMRERLAQRKENFLRLAERTIFNRPASPYMRLLRHAGCEPGDVRALVLNDGLEAALTALRQQGVYVSFDEFKGKAPIRRNGLEFEVSERDFDNPLSARHFYSESGGSTGVGTRIPQDLDSYAARAVAYLLARQAFGVLDAPFVLWRGILPDNSGMSHAFQCARTGRSPTRWYSQVTPAGNRNSLKFTFATYYALIVANFLGARIPFPRYAKVDEAHIVAREVAALLKKHGACYIATVASRGARICLAAREADLDLTGAIFMLGGEPTTDAKAQVVRNSGARLLTAYAVSEAGGRIGYACCDAHDHSDVHLMTDSVALITQPHEVDGFDVTVPAFNLTSLLPTTTKILLNAQIDDYGIVEKRACGCPFGELGLTTHLRQIRSYRKLTSEGATLVGTDMVRILEEVLPARFGGSALDYQLFEHEDEQGLTRLSILVSPRIAIDNEQAVIDTVLQALAKTGNAADAARSVWAQANSLRVKRMEPIWTGRGKLNPLHIQRRMDAAQETSAPH